MSDALEPVRGPADFDLREARALASACTHCGLCLESCPTYTLWGEEPDSPRGRIVLLEDAISTGGSLSEPAVSHLDTCVGCMACLEACPEDVRYDVLLQSARVAIAAQRQLPAAARVRRRLLVAAHTRSGRLRSLADGALIPHFTPAQGELRARVGLLLGCTERAAHSRIHLATLGVLAAEGFEVIAPARPDCCGSIDRHGGGLRAAARHAQATLDAFSAVGGVDQVVVNTGGCGATMKHYGELLGTPQARAFAALVVDVSELLARHPQRAPLAPIALRVAYHEACQLRHAQHVAQAPRELLARIPGLTLIDLPAEVGACCGATAGYAQGSARAAAQLAARQAAAVLSSGADLVLTSDHACLRALSAALEAQGSPLPVHHPVELLWSSLRAARGDGQAGQRPNAS